MLPKRHIQLAAKIELLDDDHQERLTVEKVSKSSMGAFDAIKLPGSLGHFLSELEVFLLRHQVWSQSSFERSYQLLTNDLNQVSSVSLLMTFLMALANEGLFELSRRPSFEEIYLAFSTQTVVPVGVQILVSN